MSYYNQIERADDRAYYSRRAIEESARAEKAVSVAAKRSHAELAAIFARKAAEGVADAGEPLCQGPIQILQVPG